MRHMLDTEVQDYAARYQKNPDQVLDFAKGRLNINDTQILSELESLRLRLELEAETVIEQTVNALRENYALQPRKKLIIF